MCSTVRVIKSSIQSLSRSLNETARCYLSYSRVAVDGSIRRDLLVTPCSTSFLINFISSYFNIIVTIHNLLWFDKFVCADGKWKSEWKRDTDMGGVEKGRDMYENRIKCSLNGWKIRRISSASFFYTFLYKLLFGKFWHIGYTHTL